MILKETTMRGDNEGNDNETNGDDTGRDNDDRVKWVTHYIIEGILRP